MNDPVYGPATRPEGRRGRSRPGFRSWRSARRSAADRGEDSSRKQTRIEDRFASPGPDKRAVNVALLEVYKRATCSVRNATDADAPTHILRERWRASRLPSCRRRFAALTRAARSRLPGIYRIVGRVTRRGTMPAT